MTTALLWALCVFCFVASVTPGPNNLMLMTSGVNFGPRRTMPHLLGVCLGFTLMVALVGFGLAGLFARWPVLLAALKWIGAVYMLWLAWKIANASPVKPGAGGGRPMTFLGAVAFQWVNPKAWIIGVTAVATYTVPSDFVRTVLLVATVFGLTSLFATGSWMFFGSVLRRMLQRPFALRAFNLTMAALLVASLYPALTE